VVKHFLLLFFIIGSLFARDLGVVIKDIIGSKDYYAKKKFINIIFKDSENYIDGDNINYLKVLQKLKDEGILKSTNISSPLRVAFKSKSGNNQIFLKVIKDTLFSLGFSNISTIKAVKRGKSFIWVVSLGNNYMLDPLLFAKSLMEKNVSIVGMKRYSLTNWSYDINLDNATIVTKTLEYNDIMKLSKSIRAYWLNIKDAKKIQIQSSLNNSWHPYVILYNKDLKIISSIKRDKKISKLDINVPSDAVYMKIDDLYTMKNIRDGLDILATKRE